MAANATLLRELRLSSVEKLDDLDYASSKPQERYRDFFVGKSNSSFVERYMSGDVHICIRHVEGHSGTTKASQNGFIFKAFDPAHPTHEAITALDVKSADVGSGRDKARMLPQYVELVEGPDGMIPSLVWPDRFDRRSLPLGEPLFAFDAMQRIDHALIGVKNWKVRSSIRLLAIATGERCSQKIEGGSHAVDNHAGFGHHDVVNWHNQIGYDRLHAGLRINLDQDSIRAFCVPGGEFVLEDWDLGYGPINGRLGV
jgi:hypothetical protein